MELCCLLTLGLNDVFVWISDYQLPTIANLCMSSEVTVLRFECTLTSSLYALTQISLRCSEVAPGIKPNVEGQEGADWCVVDAGRLFTQHTSAI